MPHPAGGYLAAAADDAAATAGGTLGAYKVTAHTPAAGSFAITVRNLTAGELTEAPQIRFAVIKTVNA